LRPGNGSESLRHEAETGSVVEWAVLRELLRQYLENKANKLPLTSCRCPSARHQHHQPLHTNLSTIDHHHHIHTSHHLPQPKMAPSYTLADGTVPHAVAVLKALSHFLDLIEKQPNPDALLAARLAPDMLPLSFQFYFAADTSVKLLARLSGTEPTALGDWAAIKTVADARAVVDKASSLIANPDVAAIADRADETVTFGMGPGKSAEVKAREYAAGYSLPNIFFHVVTAYAILRKEGVEIGKQDYIRHFLGPYLS